MEIRPESEFVQFDLKRHHCCKLSQKKKIYGLQNLEIGVAD